MFLLFIPSLPLSSQSFVPRSANNKFATPVSTSKRLWLRPRCGLTNAAQVSSEVGGEGSGSSGGGEDDSNISYEQLQQLLSEVHEKVTTLPEFDDEESEDEFGYHEGAQFNESFADADLNDGLDPVKPRKPKATNRKQKSTGDDSDDPEKLMMNALISDTYKVNDYYEDDISPEVGQLLNDDEANADNTLDDVRDSIDDTDTDQTKVQQVSNPRFADSKKMRNLKKMLSERQKKLSKYTEGIDDDEDIEDKYNVYLESIRNSVPFEPKSMHSLEGTNQIISFASKRFFVNLQPPRSAHPFPPLHKALSLFSHQPCPRCSSLTHVDTLKEYVGLCTECYKTIYLVDQPVKQVIRHHSKLALSGPYKTKAERDEQKELEKEQIEKAQNIVRNLNMQQQQQQQKSSSTATKTVSPTTAKASSSSSKHNSNGTGGGDGNDSSKDVARDEWKIKPSDRSLRTINPIRNLVQNITVQPNPNKQLIKLSVGDPTVYGNLKINDTILNAYVESLSPSNTSMHGYSHSTGAIGARESVASLYTTDASPLTANDVILAAGTSGALELIFGVIANEGDNVLLPQPGFPLFRTLAENFGIECRYYRLKPHQDWEADLSDFQSIVDDRTKAIVVNNPSNPCGSVFSRSHIQQICDLAEKFHLPIVADEVYADMTFQNGEDQENDEQGFVSFGHVARNVPVMCVGGVSKQFVAPGWRLGWILLHDRNQLLHNAGIYQGLQRLTTRMLIPNTPAQTMLPTLLQQHRPMLDHVLSILESNSNFMYERLRKVPGLQCIRPKGAMYMMVLVNIETLKVKDDMHFTELLLEEESVFVLPGQCFQAPNFFRIVFSAPEHILEEACSRIDSFCRRRAEGN